MKRYLIHKQLIPVDINSGDPSWAKRQVWVLKLNSTDTIDDFDTIEDAIDKLNELTISDPTNRVYKIVENISGSYIDVNF